MTAFVVQGDLRLTGAQAVRAQVTATAEDTRKLKTASVEVGTGARTGAQGLQQLGREADNAAARIREATTASALAEAQFGATARSSAAARGSFQNLGFQLQDFAVQVGSGASASQALGQQLPQLLSGFGLLGVAAGTAAAVLIPLAGYLFSAEEEAGGLEDAIGGLEDAIGAYNSYIRVSATSTQELGERFGEFSGRVREFSEFMAGVQLGVALDGADQTVEPLKAALAEIVAANVELIAQEQYLAQLRASGADAYSLIVAESGVEQLRDGISAAAQELGILPEEALRLSSAIDQIGRADGLNGIATAAADALAIMEDIAGTGQQLPGPLREAAAALAQMAGDAASADEATRAAALATAEARAQALEMAAQIYDALGGQEALNSAAAALPGYFSAATGTLGGLVAKLWEGAQAASSLMRARAAVDYIQDNQRGGTAYLANQYALYGAGRTAFDNAARESQYALPKTSKATGGGGGGAAARDETDAIERLIERREQELALLQETDPIQKEMIRQRELLADATDAQRSKVIELTIALEKEKALQESTEFFADSASGTLAEIIRDSDSAGEAIDRLKNKLIDAGIEALLLGKGPLAGIFGISGSLFGNLFKPRGGGLFAGLFGGGKADGGPIYGRGGPRDDQVLIAASPGEYMVNARATARNRALLEFINGGGDIGRFANGGAVAGGGSQVGPGSVPGGIAIPISVDARGATDGVAMQIAAALTAATPDIVQAAVAAVSRERARGRMA